MNVMCIETHFIILLEHVSGAGAELEKIRWSGSGAGAGGRGSGAVSGLNRPLTIRSNLTIDCYCKLSDIRILQFTFRISNSNTFFFVDFVSL